MIILAIDSAANRSGWAVVGHGNPKETIYRYGRVGRMAGPEMLQFLKDREGVDFVMIEGPFMGTNVRTHEMLSRWVGRWETCCEIVGLPHRVVTAQTWQIGVLKGLIKNNSPREVRKLAAQKWVEWTFGICVGEDEADAVGLATWALRQARMKARARTLRPTTAEP